MHCSKAMNFSDLLQILEEIGPLVLNELTGMQRDQASGPTD